MKKDIQFAALLFALVAIQPASAQVQPASAVKTDSALTEVSTPPTTSHTVPKLNIIWDCGDCEHNDKIVPLIEEAYAAQALKGSLVVSETDVAEVAITDIRQRPPAVRAMFGFMSGKDRLGLRIRYLGQEYTVSDTSANAIMGLNYLSASVGKRAYAKLANRPAQ